MSEPRSVPTGGSLSGYDAAARERWAPEGPKRAGRGPFARDRARVVHSSALRRLAAKTQVVGPATDDFVRNRLTHSLEVAQIGREMAVALGADADVVETACLAHDLGHPPFGHNGEVALDAVAAACGGFEGNAQTLRLLTRLEAKAVLPDGRSAGLNLTRASLDAATKYPWARGGGGDSAKYGAYTDDVEAFDWLRAGAPSRRPCVEAQLMDWADDVAYSAHDLEDGLNSGAVELGALRSPQGRADVAAVTVAVYAPGTDPAHVGVVLEGLQALPWWPRSHDGSRRDLAALKDMASQLIGRFCGAAQRATRAEHGAGPLRRYSADLVVPAATRVEVAALKGVAAHFVMGNRDRLPLLQEQRDLIADLVERLEAGAPASLDSAFAADWKSAPDDAARRRVVVDQVASLTDPSAVALHRTLGG